MKFNLLLIVCFFTFSFQSYAQEDKHIKEMEVQLNNILTDTAQTKGCCSMKKDGKCCKGDGKCSMGEGKCSSMSNHCQSNMSGSCCSSKGSCSGSSCCGPRYKNILAVGAKYYFSPLGNTRTLLRDNGFLIDEYALEFQVRLYNLPKIFYYQQLGTLDRAKYASVTGIGVKQDIRWNVVKNSPFIFMPYVEFGAGYYRMNLVKGVTDNSITSVLNSKVETNYAENFVLTGDIGANLGVVIKLDNTRLSLLVNGGFLTNIPSEWRLAGSLAFKEKVNLSSPYLGATIRLEAIR